MQTYISIFANHKRDFVSMSKLLLNCIASDGEKLLKFRGWYGLAIYEVVRINADRYCPGEIIEINS